MNAGKDAKLPMDVSAAMEKIQQFQKANADFIQNLATGQMETINDLIDSSMKHFESLRSAKSVQEVFALENQYFTESAKKITEQGRRLFEMYMNNQPKLFESLVVAPETAAKPVAPAAKPAAPAAKPAAPAKPIAPVAPVAKPAAAKPAAPAAPAAPVAKPVVKPAAPVAKPAAAKPAPAAKIVAPKAAKTPTAPKAPKIGIELPKKAAPAEAKPVIDEKK